jgi:integrase
VSRGLAETIQSPRIYSLAGLPGGPSWEQIQRLIANLNTNHPSHIRDRATILLLAVYGLRIAEVCRLTLDDVNWTEEKIRVRRMKNKRIQDFPLTAEVGNAVLKYLRKVRPRCSPRILILTLRQPYRPMDAYSSPPVSAFIFEHSALACYATARTACVMPAPHIFWMRGSRSRKLVITSVIAHQGRRKSTPKLNAGSWCKFLAGSYRV